MEITFDKVTLITGGSMGVGAGCARAFVEAGARVVICARGREKGEALAAQLNAKGPGTCHFETCDVTKQDEIKRLVERTVAMHGRLDCLINNAGMHPDHASIDGFSVEEFEDLLRLNLVSYFAACKLALPHLRKTRGNIINMGSLVGAIGQEGASTYVATKAGISGLTRALAIDEAKHGVRVNCVLPGNINSPAALALPKDLYDEAAHWALLARWGEPEEVGYACLFLASDKAAFITGIDLIISGGAEIGYGNKQVISRRTGSAHGKGR
jgi:NAD(P)-dependent dehydrogenase (short-subunit alcohol dehydrogenase family)